ncbi:hypothetical protein HPB50_015243 [Hyalomma asiaticum]|uniref:Uncharacterized protein n=1 Tax=Hyalomma asiaticum TaxID=266040 RepID=A0ACB7S098_HYAAI|nr:hypothetical protein HPB50_015243 [Hyalomma asiaticum]
MRFTLFTDPAQPTRIENSVSRDTCPDLTMARGTGAATSSRPLDETFGSDNYIAATALALTSSRRLDQVDGYDDWLAGLSADLEATTRSIDTTPTNPDTRSILRALIHPSGTKIQRQQQLHVLAHSFRDSPDGLVQELKTRYIPKGASPQFAEWSRRRITIQEVRCVLEDIRKNSAPGVDHIRYATIRNPNGADLPLLVSTFNEHWRNGTLPQA